MERVKGRPRWKKHFFKKGLQEGGRGRVKVGGRGRPVFLEDRREDFRRERRVL